MNSRIMLFILLAFFGKIQGQVLTLSDHYQWDGLDINPAFAGSNEALNASILYRNQWVGFPGAPNNLSFSMHAPLKKDNVALGIIIDKSTFGILRKTNFMINYAYRIELNNRSKLALGLGFGYFFYNADWTSLYAVDAQDTEIPESSDYYALPDFSFGAYYYSKNLFFGLSVPQFLSHELNNYSKNGRIRNNPAEYDILTFAGYRWKLSDEVVYIPSVLFKVSPGNAFQVDINNRLGIKESVFLGLNYRSDGAIIGMLALKINYQTLISYSYNYDINIIRKYTNGSHEVFLSYSFKFIKNTVNPRLF